MLNVGLTGNIAAGKSSASSMLIELGATIVDADKIVHTLQQPGSPVLAKIIKEFGQEFLLQDGNLDRSRLRRRVAGTTEALQRLNAIVHPAVAEERERQLTQAEHDGHLIVVQDIPLLFEVMDPSDFDIVVFVDAPEELRRQRLMAHRGLSPEEADRMFQSQEPSDRKRDRSDFVLDNDSGLEMLERAVLRLWKELRGKAAGAAMGGSKRLLAVFPHPDDETFATGGTLARYADAGADVHLWCATAGEAGKLNGKPVEPSYLRPVRLDELKRATDILGVADLHMGDFADGHLEQEDRRGLETVLKQVSRLQPDAIITFGPDGITGHADHKAISGWATQASSQVDLPNGIHYLTYPESVSAQFEGRLAGRPAKEIRTKLDVRPWRDVKLSAIAAHASQRFPFPLDTAPGKQLLDTEWFAGGAPADRVFADLFRGPAPA